jgi:pimeloyl-ACP methyl ester carboxylesterase
MRTTVLCAAAAISLSALTLPATAVGATDTASPANTVQAAKPTIAWHECASAGLKARGAECGDVTVPLDYSKPDGKTITVAISRIKHTVPDSEYQGPMLVNPGGPGGSGLTLSVLGEFVPKDAGKYYDWIGFDPRGVGSSKPAVSCQPEYPGAGYDRPRFEPTTKKIENAWMDITNAYTDACAKNNGPILDHVTTIEAAKDMDSIRQALGEKKINYYGFSYGTYLGQVYASLFPNNLRRTVFDGTVDPRGVWYDGNLSQDAPFDRNINIWFGWLAKHDDAYHLGDTKAKVHDLFYDTKEKLYANPVQAQGGKLGGSEWSDSFLYAGYYQSTWTDLADVFAGYVNDHDVDGLESAYLDASGYGDDNGYAMYAGVQCTDAPWPHSWKKWTKDNWAIAKDAPYETWANAWFNEPCRHWPAPSRQPATIKGKKLDSLLMIVEGLDAATPYKGNLYVRSIFPKASLIDVPDGTTHANSLNGNACVDDAIADYLLSGALPARQSGDRPDKKCDALPQPEPTSVTAQRQGASDSKTRLEMQKSAVRP